MGGEVKIATKQEDQKTLDVELLSEQELDELMAARLSAESKGEELPETTVVIDVEEDEVQEKEIDEEEEKTEDAEEKPVEEEASDEVGDERDVLISKLRKQVEEKETIFKSHSNEVGATRKRNVELESELAKFRTQHPYPKLDTEGLGDGYDSVDVEVVDKIVQQRLRQERESKALVEAQQGMVRAQNKDALQKLVPEIDSLIPDIAEIFEREGLTDSQGLAQFRADPYSQDAALVYAYAKRAHLEKQIKDLQTEKDKLKNKPAKVVAQIKKAGSQKKTIDDAGATSVGGKPPELTEERIWSMTEDELEKEIIRRLKEEEKLRS